MTKGSDIRAEYNALGARADLTALKDLANWLYISDADWTALCRASADFAGVQDGDKVFEAGCGAGAFLAELLAYRRATVAGVDFAENLIAIARARVAGVFDVADVRDLSAIESEQFDVSCSHGVFLYLDSVADAQRAARELLRITRPGGAVYIGLVNDPERAHPYEHTPSGNVMLSRASWRSFAAEQGVAIEIVDQDAIFARPVGYDGYSRVRYSLRMTKPR